MLGARWYKVFHDLWGNRVRTLLIVLSIAVGLFAIGVIVNSRVILVDELERGYAAINPSSGTVRTIELFDEDRVGAVRALDGVAEADGRLHLSVRYQVRQALPGGEEPSVEDDGSRWRDLQLFAVPDYDQMRVNKVRPHSGAWPPPPREILIERAALDLADARIGDWLLLETSAGALRPLRIAGLAHDLAQLPAPFNGMPYGYVSFETLEWLGEEQGLNELHVVAEYADDAEQVLLTINRVKASLEEDGFTIPMSLAAEPGTVPLEDILQAVLLLLGVLGVLSLLLSAFLIVNTVSALMAQQIRQIGILKVVGARSSQIVGMYLVLVLTYGALALALAVPLGVVGARALSQTMAGAFNFDLTQYRIPVLAIGLQIATGLIVPPLTALFPVLAGLRVTAAEAMRDHGMGQDRFGRGALDRLLTRQSRRRRRFLSRPLLLSLRNTFRRKGRLILTLTTLILGGAIFIGVFSVRSSLLRTLANVTEMYRSDVWINLARPHAVAQVEQLATDVPGVVRARGWTRMPVRRVRPDGSEGDDLALCAPPVEADLLHPAILEGRWLLPGDRRALVLSSGALRSEPDLAVGDEIVLKIRGSEARFTVVGVSLGLGVAPYVYAEYGEVARLAQEGSEVSSLLVVTEEHDAAFQAEVAAALETRFREAGVRVNSVQLVSEENAGTETGLRIVILLALVMAVLLAIVGGLGLTGTLSINVLERTREIGVMRAIGASNGAVAQVFIAEGVLIGVISWLFATLTAIPLSSLLGQAVGRSFLQASLSYSFSVTGALLWLAVAIVLGALASFVPARSASRLTVREVLAYE